MSTNQKDLYVLSYRSKDVEEDRRLDTQHSVIQHTILNSRLIHPSIPLAQITSGIADLACGTGIWLDDVANTLFADRGNSSPKLVGFDMNAHAFNRSPAPGVELIQHDCTKQFDASYHGKFDLVNIRGLAYALSAEGFSHVIENAVQLLRPGGYLQWLETEARLFKAYPETAEISAALKVIDTERQQRKLAPYLPHFMLRQLLSLNPESSNDFPVNPSGDLMTILDFAVLPGGFSRELLGTKDVVQNERLSEILFESLKLLLNASLIRKKSLLPGDGEDESSELEEIQRLIYSVDETRKKSDGIKMGGYFPQLIAQKSKSGP